VAASAYAGATTAWRRPAGGGCGSASAGQAASADAERRADGGKARNGKAMRTLKFFSRLDA